jgi:nickel-dependent lactate racemase
MNALMSFRHGRSALLLPWSAWHGERERTLSVPSTWSVETCAPRGAAPVSAGAVRRALEAPVAGPSLRELARGRKDACVAVEDGTRPSRLAEILPELLQVLHDAGIPRERTRIVVGSGGHAPMDRPMLVRKLGRRVVDGYAVANHNPYEDLVDLGRSPRGIPIHLNRTFHEADLKIAAGSVLPHPYAGFGGGAKIVLPGLSGIETLEANHRPVVTGVHGGLNDVETNPARAQMEEIALGVGLEAVLNVVTDARRRTVGVFFGHPVHAHRAAVAQARQVYATPPPPEPADVVVLNAYPKDGELLQVGNAFNVLRSSRRLPVRAGGVVVVTAACPLGRGWHALHGPGGRLYRTPGERTWLEGRPVVFHCPNLNEADARVSFWEGYPFERGWSGVVRQVSHLAGRAPSLVAFPCASLQLLEERP